MDRGIWPSRSDARLVYDIFQHVVTSYVVAVHQHVINHVLLFTSRQWTHAYNLYKQVHAMHSNLYNVIQADAKRFAHVWLQWRSVYRSRIYDPVWRGRPLLTRGFPPIGGFLINPWWRIAIACQINMARGARSIARRVSFWQVNRIAERPRRSDPSKSTNTRRGTTVSEVPSSHLTPRTT